MSDYTNFHVEQFASDTFFREWVLNPTRSSEDFWQTWLSQNPEKQASVKQAIALIQTLEIRYQTTLSDDMVANEVNELITRAKAMPFRSVKRYSWSRVWRIAAMLTIAGCAGWLYYHNRIKTTISSGDSAALHTNETMVTRENNSSKEMTVLLSDNSVATLMKGSKLTYPSRFTGDERKVFLSGEAFFDIAKDAKKPFLVFANETVTKVLGTSFRIKAFEKEPEVMVVVKTGRVSVYPQTDYDLLSKQLDQTVTGVVLTPNQQVVFRKKDKRLEKGIVANPEMLLVSNDQKELVFDDKPVAEVLNALENIYGIEIVFDPETVSSCVISTQFNEETLKQRMSVICQAIGATYEMIDGQIIVNSKGCGS